ncbi:sigma-70 family RNA polymerase sigma factor [Spirosoma taeanense]|uniref:Sigma-70 family RNA polymerase sigma factor n=1 Tax=Spirosoma taeanense TaxID=2735870 RepID=A0A6M5YBP0_9BACT|nr:sigma-70 family RNA polymerase sigma factor [Spirosoma taeanense]QJW90312.1 sigma-70 family RNA polymerase sigma factor [Spirosoma taeanense]
MKSSRTDEELVNQFLATHRDEYFNALYQRYHRKVYQSCLRLLNDSDEAQDQTQEIFCKVFTRLSGFRHQSRFSTWLYTLTRNHCFDVQQSRKRSRHHLSLEEVGEMFMGQTTSDEPSLDERWRLAEGALARLPVRDEQLLRVKYLMDKEIATLASEEGVSVSAMKMRLKRARDSAKLLHRLQPVV